METSNRTKTSSIFDATSKNPELMGEEPQRMQKLSK